MRRNQLLLIGAGFLIFFLPQSSTQAQYVTVSSSLSYDSATRKVNGVSQTSMDYWTTYYYRCRTKGYIYSQNSGSPLTTSDAPGNYDQSVVTVNTQVSTSPWVDYNLRTEHFLLPRVVSFGEYYDYFNYFYVSPPWTSVSQFGANQTIYGCSYYSGSCYADIVYDWIWLGNTNTSVRTPPIITLSNQFITGTLNGMTQNVLLGSPAGIRAAVTPSGLNGAYTWVITGPFAMDFTSNDNSYRSIFWTEPGTNTVTVTYAGTGFNVSAAVTVQVQVPTLTSFAGNLRANVVDRGSNCSFVFSSQFPPAGATYSVGCYQGGSQKVGMTWTATASIPNVQYMSDLSDTGIKFKQIVSLFRKRMNNGRLECYTRRNPQTDPNSGWNLDAGDPYRDEIPTFILGTTVTAPYPVPPEFDSPTTALAGRSATTGAPFEFDSVLVDDRFETYVFYFAGSPGGPRFEKPLHIADVSCPAERFDCGVDRLVWNWGGAVNFDTSVPTVLYRETISTTNAGFVAPTRIDSPRTFDPTRIQAFGYSLCEGAPNTTNPIDGSRFFLRQLYLGILNREPDPGGWDYWLSAIAQCNVDPACIYHISGRRHWVVMRFFVSPETFTRFPGLANPPGSPGFDPSVYNPAFVNACYVSLLNRSADADGYAYYMNILTQTADYDRVLDGFLESVEFRSRFGPVNPRY